MNTLSQGRAMWPTCTLYSRWFVLRCKLGCGWPRRRRTVVNAHPSEHRTAHTIHNVDTIQYVIQHRNHPLGTSL